MVNKIHIYMSGVIVPTRVRVTLSHLAGLVSEQNIVIRDSLSSYKTGAYDLLLLDINMPRMNGFKLYQEILSRHLDNHVKVCFITAFEEYDNLLRNYFLDWKKLIVLLESR
jgi:CheY-like chemotaxis protein